MPFIAIAVVLALSLGGVTYAADQAKPGDALYQYKVDVNDQVRHEYHAIRASIGAEASTNADTDANGDDNANANVGVHGMMKIRPDSTSTDPDVTNGPELNADGSVKVNVY